jgi:ribosomal protein S4
MKLQKQQKNAKARSIDPSSINKALMAKLIKSQKLKRPGINPLKMAAKGGSMSLQSAFKEVNRNEPKAVKKTRKKHGKRRAEKQKIAIAYSKARKGKRRA